MADNCVPINIKVLHPPDMPIDRMLAGMIGVYSSVGIDVQVLSTDQINDPSLNVIDVGSCSLDNPRITNDQRRLFVLRQPGEGGIAVYFVRALSPNAPDGCSVHPVGSPAVIVASQATEWTLAHEIGHVLGLRHVALNTRLMTMNGTRSIVSPPPDLSANEGQIMRQSGLLVDCEAA